MENIHPDTANELNSEEEREEERLAAEARAERRARERLERRALLRRIAEENDPDDPFRLRTEEDEWADLPEYGDGVARHRFGRDMQILRSGLSGLVQWPQETRSEEELQAALVDTNRQIERLEEEVRGRGDPAQWQEPAVGDALLEGLERRRRTRDKIEQKLQAKKA